MGAPVKHTCPDIDKAIRHLKMAIREIKGIEMEKQEYNSIEWEIEQAIGYFEDLRKSNDELRNWGEELDKELEESANVIADYEDRISELENAHNVETP